MPISPLAGLSVLFLLAGLQTAKVLMLRSGVDETLVRNVYGIYRIQDVRVQVPRLGELTVRRRRQQLAIP